MSDTTMQIDNSYAKAVEFFGVEVGNRIYADAILLAEQKQKPISEAVKIVVGSVKRIRDTATKAMSFANALDMFDEQLSEGRHYSIGSALSREVRRIEAYNKTEKAESEKAALIIEQVKAAQATQDDSADTILSVKLWVQAYMRDLSAAKGAYLQSIMKRYAQGEALGWNDQQRLRASYMPRGIGYSDFLEVLHKYAA